MDANKSKILCPINPLFIRNTFYVPAEFTHMSKDLNEESIVQFFRESTIEQKHVFFKTWFKTNVLLQNQPFLVYSRLFNDETQCVITLISQFLGLDIDKFATEPLLSLLFTISTGHVESEGSSQLRQSCCLKFDEFLAENIHSRLVDFHNTRCFRFQSYLVKMFLFFNEENFQFPEMVLTEEMNRYFSKYMNFLMSKVYNAFSRSNFPEHYHLCKKWCNFLPRKE